MTGFFLLLLLAIGKHKNDSIQLHLCVELTSLATYMYVAMI